MHADQLEITTQQVALLVSDQFPDWAALPISAVASHGTVNLLFRLGADLVLRFPMQGEDPDAVRRDLEAEADAAERIRGKVPIATPRPIATGTPGAGYPLPWAIYGWLPGTTAEERTTSPQVAGELASFVRALRAIDTEGRTFAGSGRGGALPDHDEYVAYGLKRSADLIDAAALAELWQRLRRTPRQHEPDVMTHGDLMPGNLLIEGDRLSAVIDVGGVGPADPALDLQPAWNLMNADARAVFRATLNPTQHEWDRGKGWAFAQAIGCLWYYVDTNPAMSRTAHHTLSALLSAELSDR